MAINIELYRDSQGRLDGANPLGGGATAIEAFLAAQNTEANSPTAIWASSQVTDGNGSGTFADPYSLRGAVYNATHGKEVILKDDGVYQLTNPMNIRWDYGDTNYPDRGGGTAWGGSNPKVVTMNLQKPTQESERIIVRGEQGTLPTIDCQEMRFMHVEYNQFMTFRAMKFVNTREVFNVGTDCFVDFDLIHVTMTLGGDNFSPITIQGGSTGGFATRGSTTRFYAVGPGQNLPVHQNTAGLFIRNTNNWTFKYCTVHNFPLGIYYKHPNDPSEVGGTANVEGLFENIHVYDTQRDNGNSIAGNGFTFRNCLLNGGQFGATGGFGTNGIAEGGFDIKLENVTFYENTVSFDGDARATGGSQNPTIKNTVFAGQLWGHPYDPATNFSVASSNYNLFAEDSFRVNDVFINFAAWQSQESADANSIQATPSFVGSDRSLPSDWALQTSTNGTNASDNGNDIGCDVTKVGVMGAV